MKICCLAALAAALALDTSALAAIINIDASTQVVALDSNTSSLNNSVRLLDYPGAVTLQASGNASFGSGPGQVYNSALVSYRDPAGLVQYASLPMNGPGVVLNGSHYDSALLTDLQGAIPGNTGTTTIEEIALSSVIASGTIVAGSTTSAQTGVAEISSANAAIFNTSPLGVPQYFNLTVTGDASYGAGPNHKYGSVAVWYRDATNGITYDSLPIGSSRDYFGFNFRVFITDFADSLADDSGNLTVALEPVGAPVPEPTSFFALALLPLAARSRRR